MGLVSFALIHITLKPKKSVYKKELIYGYINWKPISMLQNASKPCQGSTNQNKILGSQLRNVTTQELKAQIKKCPSGALKYYMNNKK